MPSHTSVAGCIRCPGGSATVPDRGFVGPALFERPRRVQTRCAGTKTILLRRDRDRAYCRGRINCDGVICRPEPGCGTAPRHVDAKTGPRLLESRSPSARTGTSAGCRCTQPPAALFAAGCSWAGSGPGCTCKPSACRNSVSSFARMSRFSCRNLFVFSRPWPMRSPP